MITDTLKQIADAKAKLEALEKKAEAEKSKKLSGLHKDLGFDSRADLIAALQSLEGGKTKRVRGRKAVKKAPAKKAAKGGAKKRAKRAVITDELKAKVIEDVKAGGKGSAIAKKYGISIPSLQNIKKAAGLTKPRGK